MEALALLFVLAIIFLIFSGVLGAIWWVFKLFFRIGCFFVGLALIGLVFLFLMVGCLASLV